MGPAVKVWSHEGFILTSKIAKKCLMRLKNGCSTGLQNLFEGQEKGFLWSTRYKYPKSIAKLNLSYQVWSHKGSTFWGRTKCNETAKIPALQKLTHENISFSYYGRRAADWGLVERFSQWRFWQFAYWPLLWGRHMDAAFFVKAKYAVSDFLLPTLYYLSKS